MRKIIAKSIPDNPRRAFLVGTRACQDGQRMLGLAVIKIPETRPGKTTVISELRNHVHLGQQVGPQRREPAVSLSGIQAVQPPGPPAPLVAQLPPRCI